MNRNLVIAALLAVGLTACGENRLRPPLRLRLLPRPPHRKPRRLTPAPRLLPPRLPKLRRLTPPLRQLLPRLLTLPRNKHYRTTKKPRFLNCTPKVGHPSNLWGVFHGEI